MLLKKRMVIGIALLLLLFALYLIIADFMRRRDNGIKPCCEVVRIPTFPVSGESLIVTNV